MISKYSWLLVALSSICFLYSYDYLKQSNLNFIQDGLYLINIISSGSNEESPLCTKEINPEEKVFTISELNKYTNLQDGLYISILGQVFDVTKGEKHYGPGATYHGFTGRDASLAFITGEFDNNSLTDDVSSLSIQQIKALNDWVQFYNKNYIFKGKLNGRYYNEDGSPTVESYDIKKKLKIAEEDKFKEEQGKRMFPPCNVEWKPDSGTVVWCSQKSGGIERDWIGVPRMLFESPSSQQYRCACVKLDSKEYEETKGKLREYTDCPKTSIKCTIKVNNLS